MNRNLDILADTVSDGGGRFPDSFGGAPRPDRTPPSSDRKHGFLTPEAPFSTRHFTVLFDSDGNIINTHTESIYVITEDVAKEYAQRVLHSGKTRGWLYNYRYKLFSTDSGNGVVFIDGSINRSSLLQTMTISGTVLLSCAALVLILIVLLSKRMVKPIAESYEKQKQFITDANHELKTPLTLILANLDIVEGELGKNEWLDDIRAEGHRMTALVNQLVSLSRMDEDTPRMCISDVSLSDIAADAASEFLPLAESKGKKLTAEISPDISYKGDEALLRRLLSILLDNAVKYCDDGGNIDVRLSKQHRRTVLTVENTYKGVNDTELDKLFDRFYRADRARTYTGGYGIGLSIAKMIVENHKGEITAYKKDTSYIGFRVTFKI